MEATGRKKKGGEQKEKVTSISPSPRSLAASHFVKQELAYAGHSWEKQTDSELSLPSNNMVT